MILIVLSRKIIHTHVPRGTASSQLIKSAWQVFVPGFPVPRLIIPVKEEFYGKSLIVADSEMVVTESGEMVKDAHTQDVTLVVVVVVSDPSGATTHTDIVLRARAPGIPARIIHNAPSRTRSARAVCSCTASARPSRPSFSPTRWRPESFCDRIRENAEVPRDAHAGYQKSRNKTKRTFPGTLLLHHLSGGGGGWGSVREKHPYQIKHHRSRKNYEPPRYMSIPQAGHSLPKSRIH